MNPEPNPTPAPWRARLSESGHDHEILSPDNVVIAKVYARTHEPDNLEPPYGSISEAEGRANAAAIVQAINTREAALRAFLRALGYFQQLACGQQPIPSAAQLQDIIAAAIIKATEAPK